MTFLLKIVQGPNAGAEVALPEGATVTLGRGDGCDIVLSDATLGERACELEVTGERVMMIFPDGRQTRLEPFRVNLLGTTALAVGPDEGAWRPLVWPEAHPVPTTAADAAEKPAGSAAAPSAERPEAPAGTTRKRRRTLVAAVVMIMILLAGMALTVRFLPAGGGEAGERCGFWTAVGICDPVAPAPAAPAETLEDVAQAYGLTLTAADAENPARLSGDFATRAERLEATARVYRVSPGAELDFADAESLASAVEDVLSLVTEGRLRLKSLAGREVSLTGAVASEADLRAALEALSADVPKVVRADCAGVTVGLPDPDAESDVPAAAAVIAESRQAGEAAPSMPVVGILTVPYPCLVLRDGSRVMEGARFGGYTVKTIAADHVVLGGAEGTFTWRP